MKDILEEYENNLPTGVEAETQETGIADPYNPDTIRVDTKSYSLRQIMDMITDGDLMLSPEYQRRKVWGVKEKSRLIESLLLRIPIPTFYFSATEDGRMQVVDGLQRLSTIYDFCRGGPEGEDGFFKLTDLEYLNDRVGGKNYHAFKGQLWARRIDSTQIIVNVVDPQTPERVKFDIFKRINTGGSPLNAQEVRNCLTSPKAREILNKLAQSEKFHLATHGTLRNHPRMADLEICLRFASFFFMDTDQYTLFKGLANHLNDTTKKLDTLSGADINRLILHFETAMVNAKRLFGEYAFRKWPAGNDTKYPINRSLFDVWSLHLARHNWCDLEPYSERIVAAFRKAMAEDEVFIASISTATGNMSKILTRFRWVKQLLEGTLHAS